MDGSNDAQAELDSVEAELELVELQISDLLQKQTELTGRKDALLLRLQDVCVAAQPSSSKPPGAPPALSKQEMQLYDGTDFPWSKDLEQHLKDSFRLSSFRPLQLRAINLTMSGRELFLVMPTGRGKSLCYQLPAVCSKGFTLVVSPLVSLMEDQIMYLKSIDVPAVMLNASSSKEHAKMVMAGLTDPKAPFKLLYVTPEKIAKSKLLMSRLEKAHNAELLSRIAVDEVHCCSQWGHDFRPDYKLLGILKRQFPTVPLLGLTATATSSVLKDCEKILCVPQPITMSASFNRTNLYYEVRIKDSNHEASISDIASLIKNKYKDQSGIVYVFSQKDAEAVSSALQASGVLAFPYHSHMEAADKSRVHRKWTANKIQVVVATVAFGMGIDKPDVRFVIHHTLSKSIENYYQESGRAGRDDRPADCVLYFGFSDIFRISTMVVMENVGQQKLLQIVDYCQNVDRCRRSLMSVHFDEVWDDEGCNQMCDACRHAKDYADVDITQHAKQVVQILELAAAAEERLTPLKLVEAWMGKGPAKRRKMISTTSLSRLQAEAVVVMLLLKGYLREDFSFTPYTTYFYMKLGRKAPLLKVQTHSLVMKMGSAGSAGSEAAAVDTSANEEEEEEEEKEKEDELDEEEEQEEEECDVTFDRVVVDHSRPPPPPRQKVCKEQRNRSRKQLEEGRSFISPRRGVEVDVEIVNIVDDGAGRRAPPRPVKPSSKRRAATPQRARSRPRPASPAASPAASVLSETAAEELCDLREYYSRQLRRMEHASREQLRPEEERGVLACIRAPLRSLGIGHTARSLWTRVSGRRRRVAR